MRKGKEKKGVESAAVCSAQFLNQSLTGFSRCFLSGEHRRGGRGRGAGKNITKPRFDRVILAGCVWKWQGVLPLFTFDAIFPRPFRSAHSSSASKASDIFHSFEIVLPSRFPSFPILSFLLLTLHPQRLFPVKRRYRCDARELDTDLRFIFFISLDAFDRLKYNSSTQREFDR